MATRWSECATRWSIGAAGRAMDRSAVSEKMMRRGGLQRAAQQGRPFRCAELAGVQCSKDWDPSCACSAMKGDTAGVPDAPCDCQHRPLCSSSSSFWPCENHRRAWVLGVSPRSTAARRQRSQLAGSHRGVGWGAATGECTEYWMCRVMNQKYLILSCSQRVSCGLAVQLWAARSQPAIDCPHCWAAGNNRHTWVLSAGA